MFVSKRLMVHEGLGIIRQFGRKSRKNTIQRQQKLPKPEYDPYFAMKMMRCHDFTLSDPTVALSVQYDFFRSEFWFFVYRIFQLKNWYKCDGFSRNYLQYFEYFAKIWVDHYSKDFLSHNN